MTSSYRLTDKSVAGVFVNNVTDETAYSTLILDVPRRNATLLDPRTYGASLDLNF